MVNSKEFSERLQKIFAYYELSAASFAEKIDVGRASISHILSGRNKPSLDFVMKVVGNFPEVELYWLLNGKGSFPKNEQATTPSPTKETAQPEQIKSTDQSDLNSEKKQFPNNTDSSADVNPKNHKTIDKVIVFYTDGTFEAYRN
ncbi:MAG: helix-turn-helix transcriptional regulator [Bacteroidota bacterium]